MDVYFSVTHLTLGIVTTNRASSALLVPGFFGLLCGLLFGLRYAATIRVTTYRPPVTTPAPTAPVPAPAAVQISQDSLPRRSIEVPNTSTPLLARADRGPQAVADWDAVEQAENRKSKAQMYCISHFTHKLIAFLAEIAIFLAVAATVITTFAYFGWFPIVMVVTYSYWVPQIYQNAERGTGRLPLLHSYILVTALARLLIPLYVWACPSEFHASTISPR